MGEKKTPETRQSSVKALDSLNQSSRVCAIQSNVRVRRKGCYREAQRTRSLRACVRGREGGS